MITLIYTLNASFSYTFVWNSRITLGNLHLYMYQYIACCLDSEFTRFITSYTGQLLPNKHVTCVRKAETTNDPALCVSLDHRSRINVSSGFISYKLSRVKMATLLGWHRRIIPARSSPLTANPKGKPSYSASDPLGLYQPFVKFFFQTKFIEKMVHRQKSSPSPNSAFRYE